MKHNLKPGNLLQMFHTISENYYIVSGVLCSVFPHRFLEPGILPGRDSALAFINSLCHFITAGNSAIMHAPLCDQCINEITFSLRATTYCLIASLIFWLKNAINLPGGQNKILSRIRLQRSC